MNSFPRMRASAAFISKVAAGRNRPLTTTTTTTTTTTKQSVVGGSFHRLTQQQQAPIHHQSQANSFQLLRRMYSPTPRYSMALPTGEEMLLHMSNGNRLKLEGNDIPLAMESLIKTDVVCIDVDSTIIDEEGIDVLAAYLGQGEAVAHLTKQAMEGGMKFQDALAARLDLLQPSLQDIRAFQQQHPFRLTPGIQDFIEKLHDANKHVFLVSGGFRIMIEPVAERLQIPTTNIVANTILFDEDGNYAGFDEKEPTSQDMGKQKALQRIQDYSGGRFETMVMIGDGATDAQAKPPATAFIGFGGVVVRPKVKDLADWFVTDFNDLSRLLDDFPSTNTGFRFW